MSKDQFTRFKNHLNVLQVEYTDIQERRREIERDFRILQNESKILNDRLKFLDHHQTQVNLKLGMQLQNPEIVVVTNKLRDHLQVAQELQQEEAQLFRAQLLIRDEYNHLRRN